MRRFCFTIQVDKTAVAKRECYKAFPQTLENLCVTGMRLELYSGIPQNKIDTIVSL